MQKPSLQPRSLSDTTTAPLLSTPASLSFPRGEVKCYSSEIWKRTMIHTTCVAYSQSNICNSQSLRAASAPVWIFSPTEIFKLQHKKSLANVVKTMLSCHFFIFSCETWRNPGAVWKHGCTLVFPPGRQCSLSEEVRIIAQKSIVVAQQRIRLDTHALGQPFVLMHRYHLKFIKASVCVHFWLPTNCTGPKSSTSGTDFALFA